MATAGCSNFFRKRCSAKLDKYQKCRYGDIIGLSLAKWSFPSSYYHTFVFILSLSTARSQSPPYPLIIMILTPALPWALCWILTWALPLTEWSDLLRSGLHHDRTIGDLVGYKQEMETSNNSNNHNPGQCQTAWNTSSSLTNGLMSVWYYWYSQSRSGGEGWWCRADISQQEVVCHLPSAETWTETDRWTGSVLITGFHTTENIVIINSVTELDNYYWIKTIQQISSDFHLY